jgi:hypothetical protein
MQAKADSKSTSTPIFPSKPIPIRLLQLILYPRSLPYDHYEYQSICEHTETTYTTREGARMDRSACGGVIRVYRYDYIYGSPRRTYNWDVLEYGL